MTYSRHTMGQDWGGRRPMNPPNCPKVTRKQVLKFAENINVTIWREGYGMWWFMRDDGASVTLGQTNYIALEYLKRMKIENDMDYNQS